MANPTLEEARMASGYAPRGDAEDAIDIIDSQYSGMAVLGRI